MPNLSPAAETYVCPGQTHSISRSVHLARLAAWYPACRDCVFREDMGALRVALPESNPTASRTKPDSLIAGDGFRGRHRNQFDRRSAARLASAFASMLWERNECGRESQQPPLAVVGYDQRPASPDILAGVVDGLKRSSVAVVDVGPVSYPHLVFTSTALEADGGMMITGAGRDPSWTGVDFLGPGAVPISDCREANERGRCSMTLDEIERRSRQPFNRPSRAAGRLRLHRNAADYEQSLVPHFHALRPLRVVVATPTSSLRTTADRVFVALPCRLTGIQLPVRSRKIADPDDADSQTLSRAVLSHRADVGFLIDEDGQACAVCDETGRMLPTFATARWLATHQLADAPAGPILLGDGFDAEFSLRAASILRSRESRADVHNALLQSGGVFAATSNGRYWFREEESAAPLCDALLTLANVLAALSRSDATCSESIAHATTYGGS